MDDGRGIIFLFVMAAFFLCIAGMCCVFFRWASGEPWYFSSSWQAHTVF